MAKIDVKILVVTGTVVMLFSLGMMLAVRYRFEHAWASGGIVWWQSPAVRAFYPGLFLSGLLATLASGMYEAVQYHKKRNRTRTNDPKV